MEEKRRPAITNIFFSRTFLFLILLFGLNLFIFREMFYAKKLPIAFDYGVYTYEPWRIEFKERFDKPPKPIGHDDIKIFYPQRKIITDSLKRGIIPFWNPYTFAGNVMLANSQTAVFYPPFFLFLFVNQINAWSLLSFSIPFLSGLGTYLFLRTVVKSWPSSVFASLVFAYSSSIITRTQDGLVAGHSILWLPFVLYGIELYFKHQNWKGICITLFCLTFSMLAGWFQFTFYVFAVSLLYSLVKVFGNKQLKSKYQLLFAYLSIFGSAILLTGFHWLPSLQALLYSPRGILSTPSDFSSKHLMPISHLLTLVIPEFFGNIASGNYFGASEFKEGVIAIGIIPFLIAILGFSRKRKSLTLKFFIVLLIISLLLGLKTPIAETLISLNLPLVSSFLPNRVLILATFSLAILSAFGIEELIHGKKKSFERILKTAISVFISGYVLILMLYVYEKGFSEVIGFSFFEKGIERYLRIMVQASLLPLLLLLSAFIITRRLKETSKLLIVLLILAVVGQIFAASRYLYFSRAEHEFPSSSIFNFLKEKTEKDHSRFITLSYSRIPANIPSFYKLFFPEGIDAMYPIWYAEFADFYEGKDISTDDVMRIETTFSEELERRRWYDPKTINLLSHLGIRYVIVPKDAYHIIPPESAFQKVFSYKWHTVYEYRYAFPRAYFVPNASLISDKTLTLQRIYHPMFFTNREVVIAENANQVNNKGNKKNATDLSNIDLKKKQQLQRDKTTLNPYSAVEAISTTFNENPVIILEEDTNIIVLKAEVYQPGVIVISESYFPGWTAKVDGRDVALYRANHAFMAVPILPGVHQIILSYFPNTFRYGIFMSFFGFSLTSLLLAWSLKLRINKPN